MNRWLGAGVCLAVAVAGCETPPKLVEPFPVPSRASGAWVVLEDRRPEWEKAPFTGPVVSLYRLTRVSPNPWVRLQQATEAVVADLPEKPERVDVVVASFRLVSKEADPAPRREEGGTVQVVGQNGVPLGTGANRAVDALNYERARSAASSGDRNLAEQATAALGMTGSAPATSSQIQPTAIIVPDGALDGLAPGATCALRGVIRVTYPGGAEKDVPFAVLAGRPNETGSRYWGETLEQAAQLAMLQYTRQVRQGVGLPGE
jgi:hypothetical protein